MANRTMAARMITPVTADTVLFTSQAAPGVFGFLGLLHAAHQSPAGAVLVPNRVFGVNRKAFSHTVNELPSQEV